jgi:hypothetical protein
MEVPNANPLPFSSASNGLAVENIQGQFEMSIGLFERSNRLFDLDSHSDFLFDMVP